MHNSAIYTTKWQYTNRPGIIAQSGTQIGCERWITILFPPTGGQKCVIIPAADNNRHARWQDEYEIWRTNYRAMHLSAKRGIAIACRPSVCLSVCPCVTLVDQVNMDWTSWKLSARTIRPAPSLFVAQRPSTYSQGNMGKFGRDWRWGGKNGVLKHKSGNISERCKDRGNAVSYTHLTLPTKRIV